MVAAAVVMAEVAVVAVWVVAAMAWVAVVVVVWVVWVVAAMDWVVVVVVVWVMVAAAAISAVGAAEEMAPAAARAVGAKRTKPVEVRASSASPPVELHQQRHGRPCSP